MPTFSYLYSIPYLLFLFYLLILVFIEFRQLNAGKDTTFIRWATIIGVIFFIGFRGFIYSDWLVYYKLFEKIPTIWDAGLSSISQTDFSDLSATDVNVGKSGIEIGFLYFTYFLKSIAPNYFVWVFINTVIDVFILDIFFRRYSKYYVFGFIIFIVFGGMMIECNLMRNVKAILLFLISLKYIEERKILPYMLLNLAGILFHSSAIIFIPLYFILNKVWPKWLMWSIFIVGNILFVFHISYLEPIMLKIADIIGGRLAVQIKLYFAIDIYSQSYGLSPSYIERVITFLAVILFQNKLIEQRRSNCIFINAYVLYFVCFFFFSEIMVAVERLTLIFIFSYWIIYPELLYLIKQIVYKIIVFGTMILYCALKLIDMNSNILSRYDNVVFGIMSYEERSDNFHENMDSIISPQ